MYVCFRSFNMIHPNISEDPEYMSWLTDMCSKPTKLKQLCRIRIRRLLSHDIQNEALHVNLPPALRDYILLKDVL